MSLFFEDLLLQGIFLFQIEFVGVDTKLKYS